MDWVRGYKVAALVGWVLLEGCFLGSTGFGCVTVGSLSAKGLLEVLVTIEV